MPSSKMFFLWRHLNKLRWLTLSSVILVLILIPYLHLYQSYTAAHAYDLLASSEKRVYDVMELLTAPFTSEPAEDLDVLKGNTWSATIGGVRLSDPLAVLSQFAASLSVNWSFLVNAIIPVLFTLFFGRVFCGWICPATFIYELNSNLASWLRWAGIKLPDQQFDGSLKYVVLIIGLILSLVTGSVLISAIYPPAIVGREIYYAIALEGFGVSAVFFIFTLLFDLLVARRGFCRYLCPGGALYSLLSRYRVLRIRRIVENCNDCAKCNVVCEFGLDPMGDNFSQECTNCAACIAVCPTQAMTFVLKPTDYPVQGAGHLGRRYHREQDKFILDGNAEDKGDNSINQGAA